MIKELDMKIKSLFIMLLIPAICMSQNFDPLTGEIINPNFNEQTQIINTQNDPCIQAAIDAQNDVNGGLWYGAGCLFGILGLGASYLIEPNPNVFKLAGKSSDYAAIYTGCYRIEAKKIQQQKARNGCLTYAAVYLLIIMTSSSGN